MHVQYKTNTAFSYRHSMTIQSTLSHNGGSRTPKASIAVLLVKKSLKCRTESFPRQNSVHIQHTTAVHVHAYITCVYVAEFVR